MTVVSVHAIDVKFGPPQKTLRPPWCPKLVRGHTSLVGMKCFAHLWEMLNVFF